MESQSFIKLSFCPLQLMFEVSLLAVRFTVSHWSKRLKIDHLIVIPLPRKIECKRSVPYYSINKESDTAIGTKTTRSYQ